MRPPSRVRPRTLAVAVTALVLLGVVGFPLTAHAVVVCTITGTEGNDDLKGTSGNDVICGLGGNDTLTGLKGNDQLYGGDGLDGLMGGPGSDLFDGGSGIDTVFFHDHNNTTAVTASLVSGAVSSTYLGVDTIVLDGGLSTVENLSGGAGNDTFTGDAQGNVLNGKAGDDSLSGGFGSDLLIGGIGDDPVLAGEGDNDRIQPGEGNDVASGGDGLSDTLDYSQLTTGTGVVANIANNTVTGGAGTDGASEFENLQGSPYDDTLTAGGGNNVLVGNGGVDSFTAAGGDDTLYSRDLIAESNVDGGGGTDTCYSDVTDTLISCMPGV